MYSLPTMPVPFQVAASLVLCTFMSAPIMYVSARMVLITYATYDEYASIITTTQRDVTIVTVICVVRISNMFEVRDVLVVPVFMK